MYVSRSPATGRQRRNSVKREYNEDELSSIQQQLHGLVNGLDKVANKLNDLKKSRGFIPEERSQNQFLQAKVAEEQPSGSGRGLSATESLHTSQQVFLQQPQQQNYPICFLGPNQAAVFPMHQTFHYPNTFGQQQSFFQPAIQHRSSSMGSGSTPVTCLYLAPPPHFSRAVDGVSSPRVETVIPTILTPVSEYLPPKSDNDPDVTQTNYTSKSHESNLQASAYMNRSVASQARMTAADKRQPSNSSSHPGSRSHGKYSRRLVLFFTPYKAVYSWVR